jgi:hypothetical protein
MKGAPKRVKGAIEADEAQRQASGALGKCSGDLVSRCKCAVYVASFRIHVAYSTWSRGIGCLDVELERERESPRGGGVHFLPSATLDLR